MNMLGLIFADEHSSDISDLTTRRTFAAIPFGARYRIIDFFISNMTNSGVRNIGVIATTKYESLMGHVRYGGEWDLHRRKTGLTVLPPFSFFNGEERYENVLEALQANINYIKENSKENRKETGAEQWKDISRNLLNLWCGRRFFASAILSRRAEGRYSIRYVMEGFTSRGFSHSG